MTEPELAILVFREQLLVATHVLRDDVIKVGRLDSSHIKLDDPEVARMHAVLEESDSGWTIIDLGSKGGTLIDGRPISKAVLAIGQRFEVGPYTLELRLASQALGLSAEDAAPPRRRCPSCGSREPKITTEVQARFTAPDLSSDCGDVVSRLRGEICRKCAEVRFFVLDLNAILPDDPND